MKVHCFLFLAVSYIFGDSFLKIMDYIDTKSKCRHMKILTCKKTLRQVFIRVYRLEIQSVMLVFSTQLYPSNLLSGSIPPPLHRVHTGWQRPLSGVHHHDGKISPGWRGSGVQAHPLSLYLPSRTKLQCTLLLRGQIHSPYLISVPMNSVLPPLPPSRCESV